MTLVCDRQNLNGREFRFLRHELNQTQVDLAAILGVSVQRVACWEKGRTKIAIDGPAKRLLRLIYKEYVAGNQQIVEPLKELAQLDELGFEEVEQFGFALHEGWQSQIPGCAPRFALTAIPPQFASYRRNIVLIIPLT